MKHHFFHFWNELVHAPFFNYHFGFSLATFAFASTNLMAFAQEVPKPKVPGQNSPEKMPPFVSHIQKIPEPTLPPLPPNKRVGFAVVGLGRLTLETILPAFGECQLAKLVAVMTGDPQGKGKRVAAEYGVNEEAVYSYEEWEKLKNNKEVQVVYIVTPNGLHKEEVLQAARIGKHVLCEKPMANNSAEAQTMIDACKQAGVKLMIAYRCQYEPHHLALIEIARSGKFGPLKMIEAHNGQVQSSIKQWRLEKDLAGGGSLPDVGIYCLNFARYITKEEPVEVSAWLWSPPNDARFKEVESNVAWQMRFPSGIVARLASSYDSYEARPARLYFEKAVVELNPAFSYQGVRMKIIHRSPEKTDVNIEEEEVMGNKNAFALEMDHMAECVLNDKQPRTPGEEGLQDHKIMEAIYQSARENKNVEIKYK